jgi:hypothetical protein
LEPRKEEEEEEELHNLYSSPDFKMVIKSRRMKWTERMECMGR